MASFSSTNDTHLRWECSGEKFPFTTDCKKDPFPRHCHMLTCCNYTDYQDLNLEINADQWKSQFGSKPDSIFHWSPLTSIDFIDQTMWGLRYMYGVWTVGCIFESRPCRHVHINFCLYMYWHIPHQSTSRQNLVLTIRMSYLSSEVWI